MAGRIFPLHQLRMRKVGSVRERPRREDAVGGATFCVVEAASSIKGGARHWNDASPMPLTTRARRRA